MATVTKPVRKKMPSQKRLRTVMGDSLFDPRGDGPNKIIAETALDSPQYAETRALELVREAQLAVDNVHTPEDLPTYVANMRRAIGLLTLALAIRTD